MTKIEHVDVLVIGAGISGIGAGYHLQTKCPGRSYVILEGRDQLGGTWDLFRYPGVRSDSDMHTLGFSFKPWTDAKSIADGESILDYLKETATEFGIDRHIRFNHRMTSADWSSEHSLWTVTVKRSDAGEDVTFTTSFLFMCAGYYSYQDGYTPDFTGIDDFEGEVVHPQRWPENLDYNDKNVVVVGSGATAMTIVPAVAQRAKHVTMLQRSPTYVVARPDYDIVADGLRKVLPEKIAYQLTRRKNIALGQFFYRQTRRWPDQIKRQLLNGVRAELGDDYDVGTHFTPSYDPWDQRLCLVPNGDLFEAIRTHRATVVTDTIDHFTPAGIQLTSGEHLDADIVVTATGLQLVTLGEASFSIDGEIVDFSDTWSYKGLGFSDVPNLVATFGYVNASWTLRADLTSEFVCKLLNYLSASGATQCTPRLRPSDGNMPARPWIDDFSAGYIQRMLPMLPKQGDRAPWINTQSYREDRKLLGDDPVDDGVMTFTRPVVETVV